MGQVLVLEPISPGIVYLGDLKLWTFKFLVKIPHSSVKLTFRVVLTGNISKNDPTQKK